MKRCRTAKVQNWDCQIITGDRIHSNRWRVQHKICPLYITIVLVSKSALWSGRKKYGAAKVYVIWGGASAITFIKIGTSKHERDTCFTLYHRRCWFYWWAKDEWVWFNIISFFFSIVLTDRLSELENKLLLRVSKTELLMKNILIRESSLSFVSQTSHSQRLQESRQMIVTRYKRRCRVSSVLDLHIPIFETGTFWKVWKMISFLFAFHRSAVSHDFRCRWRFSHSAWGTI